eukprot:CAMPEP_0185737846 /NCGR_PEP_ID=MMETSP1171-20130828/31427_1 /TAXON_ID=374046 /ORGANISM="Helicotheca tamensis, Strain CCMP826" /LENGTH=56 /DNA_ID=CAMNT_0028408865 /DNA_START=139 /DNA_END=306 /DNA_ORIENTATION=+
MGEEQEVLLKEVQRKNGEAMTVDDASSFLRSAKNEIMSTCQKDGIENENAKNFTGL